MPPWLARVTYDEPLQRDFRSFHLADQRRVGERIQERERLEIDAVGVPGEEQRVRLDGVEHRRRRALGDVDVDRAQVLGEDRAGRAVVGADVLEDRAVAGLLRMVIDHQVGAVEHPAEVVRLHVHGGDALELLERRRRDLLDVDVEHVGHPQVLRPGHALDRADDGRGLGAPQQVAQRQAAGERVGVGIVVQQDQHPVGVGEVALILLHPRAGHRPAQFGDERRADQLAQADVRDVRLGRARVFRRSSRSACRCAARKSACRRRRGWPRSSS